MKTSLKSIKFSAALLAGLFAGIIAAIANLIYDMEYRSITDLSAFKIVNPLSIFVFSTIGLMIAGMIFYEFIHYIKKGILFFEALFIVLTIIGLILLGFRMTGFRGLLLGIGIITGLICIILIPYLSRHPNIYFEEDVA
jgi:magnesium-transporting ATPase (P-type)